MALVVDMQKQCGSLALDISLTANEGVHGLLGVSGAGKSMTLKCIAGIETPDAGRIVLGDRVLFDSAQGINLPPQQRKVGYLFQNYALFPTMTVEKNIGAGCQSKDKSQQKQEVAALMDTLQLTHLAKKYPHQISGGEQQRVALARILASQPEALLLDEPLSALDSFLKWQVELELSDFLKTFPHPVLFVSHNQEEIAHLCQQVWVVSNGTSQEKTTVDDLFHRPKTVAACLLSGCKNLSPATVENGKIAAHDWGVTLASPTPPPEGLTHVAIHGHKIQIVEQESDNTICCRISKVFQGKDCMTVLATPPNSTMPLHIEVAGMTEIDCKKDLWVRLPQEDLLLFCEAN